MGLGAVILVFIILSLASVNQKLTWERVFPSAIIPGKQTIGYAVRPRFECFLNHVLAG